MWSKRPMTRSSWMRFGSRFGKKTIHPFSELETVSGKSFSSIRQSYARRTRFTISTKNAHNPLPPPLLPPSSIEDACEPGHIPNAQGPFDTFLNQTALDWFSPTATDFATLYGQYRDRTGKAIDRTVPYEERPAKSRRADNNGIAASAEAATLGDGIVMVVHALFKANGQLDKVCACSGFAIDARLHHDQANHDHGDVVITCAHTLEEMHRSIRASDANPSRAFSLVIPANGRPRRVTQVLTSMPQSDVIALEVEFDAELSLSQAGCSRLRTLPLSPFPVDTGSILLTHLFSGSGEPPVVQQSRSRLPTHTTSLSSLEREVIQKPVPWLQEKAWRRWGLGIMLGYRSYTGQDVEAGNHSSLPHILTSVLPTPGASGGPLVCGETGAVVGMISGRRMDNRVEGERGWGTSAEAIFEMFALPGFISAGKT